MFKGHFLKTAGRLNQPRSIGSLCFVMLLLHLGNIVVSKRLDVTHARGQRLQIIEKQGTRKDPIYSRLHRILCQLCRLGSITSLEMTGTYWHN